MSIAFGVDIGGTQIKFGAFTEQGELLEKWTVPTDLTDCGRKILPAVTRQIKEYSKGRRIIGIGLGIPGPVDRSGYVKVCVNLHWTKFNPVKELEKDFSGIRLAAGNDANVAALGEYYKGAGRGCKSMMLVTLGTGVGGGIVIDGRVFPGDHGIAGEIGHISAGVPESEKCNCGNTGCIDQFASATGIVRIMKKLLKERYADIKSGQLQTKLTAEGFTARDVCYAAKNGDELAKECLDICMGALGVGLAYFSHAFDPEIYVIGGGVSNAGDIIIQTVKKAYARKLFLIDKGPEIKLADLGNDAGMIGACMLVLNGE